MTWWAELRITNENNPERVFSAKVKIKDGVWDFRPETMQRMFGEWAEDPDPITPLQKFKYPVVEDKR